MLNTTRLKALSSQLSAADSILSALKDKFNSDDKVPILAPKQYSMASQQLTKLTLEANKQISNIVTKEADITALDKKFTINAVSKLIKILEIIIKNYNDYTTQITNKFPSTEDAWMAIEIFDSDLTELTLHAITLTTELKLKLEQPNSSPQELKESANISQRLSEHINRISIYVAHLDESALKKAVLEASVVSNMTSNTNNLKPTDEKNSESKNRNDIENNQPSYTKIITTISNTESNTNANTDRQNPATAVPAENKLPIITEPVTLIAFKLPSTHNPTSPNRTSTGRRSMAVLSVMQSAIQNDADTDTTIAPISTPIPAPMPASIPTPAHTTNADNKKTEFHKKIKKWWDKEIGKDKSAVKNLDDALTNITETSFNKLLDLSNDWLIVEDKKMAIFQNEHFNTVAQLNLILENYLCKEDPQCYLLLAKLVNELEKWAQIKNYSTGVTNMNKRFIEFNQTKKTSRDFIAVFRYCQFEAIERSQVFGRVFRNDAKTALYKNLEDTQITNQQSLQTLLTFLIEEIPINNNAPKQKI